MPLSSPAPRALLVVLDGWGLGPEGPNNAIHVARTPVMDRIWAENPHATLRTDSGFVGLPEGQMGNSEVGHMHLGAGRVVYQDLLRIDRAVAEGSIRHEPALRAAFDAARSAGGRLHLMGLVSQGGVHSQQAHLHALCEAAAAEGIEVLVHAFTDGRDTAPHTGRGYLAELQTILDRTGGRIATVHGRYYAMDRDRRWERVARSWRTLVRGEGPRFDTADAGIAAAYAEGTTDEFIVPFTVGTDATAGCLRPGDAVLCFNFRTDRCREITEALVVTDMPDHGMHTLPLHYTTMTRYDERWTNVHVLYDKPNLAETLGEVVAAAGRTQIRIAETEKYPHVTYFFSGGREEPFPGETRLMAPSPKVATYDLAPEMSAVALTDAIVPELAHGNADFVCLNFANPDMVGHTGVFDAIVAAVEATDTCLGRVLAAAEEGGYAWIVLADHGNADLARNPDGSPHTAHTTHPVPVVVRAPGVTAVRDGSLPDVAPTLLHILGIAQPAAMTGTSLV